MNRSPLGKYAQIVAAVIAVGVIGLWAVAELAYSADLLTHAPDSLRTAALLALGAVFGSAAAINGVKEPIDSAHQRIDHIENATGIPTHGAYQGPSTPPGTERPAGDA